MRADTPTQLAVDLLTLNNLLSAMPIEDNGYHALADQYTKAIKRGQLSDLLEMLS